MCGSFFRKLISPVAVCFFLFLLSNCGLETMYYLESPIIIHEANIGDDRQQNYFEFFTGNNADFESDDSEFFLHGTEVYYKIFANKNDCIGSYTNIQSYNGSSDVSACASYIINSKKYCPLISLESSDTPIISGSNLKVLIRLTDISEDKKNCIEFGANKFHPKRYYQNSSRKLGFMFSTAQAYKDDNPVPESGNSDVVWSSSREGGIWYVDMWAFTSGIDNTYTPSYSRALHLGMIKIEERDFN